MIAYSLGWTFTWSSRTTKLWEKKNHFNTQDQMDRCAQSVQQLPNFITYFEDLLQTPTTLFAAIKLIHTHQNDAYSTRLRHEPDQLWPTIIRFKLTTAPSNVVFGSLNWDEMGHRMTGNSHIWPNYLPNLYFLTLPILYCVDVSQNWANRNVCRDVHLTSIETPMK